VNIAFRRPTGLLGERGTVSPAGYLTLAGPGLGSGHFLPCKYFETFCVDAGDVLIPPDRFARPLARPRPRGPRGPRRPLRIASAASTPNR